MLYTYTSPSSGYWFCDTSYVTLKAPQFWLHYEKLVILMCSLWKRYLLYAKVSNKQLIKVFIRVKLTETPNLLQTTSLVLFLSLGESEFWFTASKLLHKVAPTFLLPHLQRGKFSCADDIANSDHLTPATTGSKLFPLMHF